MTAHVTNHGQERMRERVGLNKDASARLAQRALDRGVKHADTSGALRRFLDGLYLAHRQANNTRVYGEFVYLFQAERLITVVSLPRQFRRKS